MCGNHGDGNGVIVAGITLETVRDGCLSFDGAVYLLLVMIRSLLLSA